MTTYGQGGSRSWRRTRQEVFERDFHECQLRYPGCTFTATEIHHIHGLQGMARSDCDDADCMAVCGSCHRKVTDRQRAAGQMRMNAARRARRRLPQQPHPGDP